MRNSRLAIARSHTSWQQRDQWLTLWPDPGPGGVAGSFGALERFAELRLPVGAKTPPVRRHCVELVTYVREGALAWNDSLGRSGVLHAGEFERLSADQDTRSFEQNASQTGTAHVFQIWLRAPQLAARSSREQKRFSAAERGNGLCLVASLSGRAGSLTLGRDAEIYSALLRSGQHLVHPLGLGRAAWLHIVFGAAALDDLRLGAGDGAGVVDERVLSFTAQGATEVLLLELPSVEPP